MTVLLSAIGFFILLTLLVLIHELGHFAAARWSGVTVEEFGFGLPPRIRTLFSHAGTRFSLNWIPFGGFVRLQGESAMTEKQRRAKGSFGSVSIPRRVLILVAGVLMNFLFSILIFVVGFSAGHWIPTYTSYADMQSAAARGEISFTPAVLIDQAIADGAAAEAGLPVPSILESIDGTPVTDPSQVPSIQQGKQIVVYSILTGQKFTERQTITLQVKEGKTGVALRIFPKDLTAPSRSPVESVRLSFREAQVMTVQTVLGMGTLFRSLFTSGQVPAGITGIVGIAQLTHASVQDGFATYLRLMALLSLSLAVLNILPLPALDGGRLVFVLAELVARRPVNRQFEMITNMLGFAFLILLILVITYHDVIKLF